jgi:hypothetical protein
MQHPLVLRYLLKEEFKDREIELELIDAEGKKLKKVREANEITLNRFSAKNDTFSVHFSEVTGSPPYVSTVKGLGAQMFLDSQYGEAMRKIEESGMVKGTYNAEWRLL